MAEKTTHDRKGDHDSDSHLPTLVSAEYQAEEITREAHNLTRKESMSAYFTIAAAAFGLISDGCELFGSFF